MQINEKDFLEWLHEQRRKNKDAFFKNKDGYLKEAEKQASKLIDSLELNIPSEKVKEVEPIS